MRTPAVDEQEERRDAFGKQQFNIYLPPELVRAIKHAAIDEAQSLSGFVERIFRAYLAEGKEQEHDR